MYGFLYNLAASNHKQMSYTSELKHKRILLVKQIEAIDLLLSLEGQTVLDFSDDKPSINSSFREKGRDDNWLDYVKDALRYLGGKAHTKEILDLVERSNPNMSKETTRRQTSVMLSKYSKEGDERAFIQHKIGNSPKKGADYELI